MIDQKERRMLRKVAGSRVSRRNGVKTRQRDRGGNLLPRRERPRVGLARRIREVLAGRITV